MFQQPMLLEDCVGYTTIQLSESVNGHLKFRGKFQEANAVNKNKRMYPFDVLAGNVEKLEECVHSRGLYGELDHPTDSIIHLSNASHVVTKLWWEGNTLMGEGEILPTPSGMILKKLIESGCRIGISSRGVGNGQTNNEGVLVIGESYRLIAFDAVAEFRYICSRFRRRSQASVTNIMCQRTTFALKHQPDTIELTTEH